MSLVVYFFGTLRCFCNANSRNVRVLRRDLQLFTVLKLHFINTMLFFLYSDKSKIMYMCNVA